MCKTNSNDETWCWCYFLFSDEDDSFSFDNKNGPRNGNYSSGSRPGWHGRTFYGRRPQQPLSVTAPFNTKGQKSLTRDFTDDDGEANHDSSWHHRQINLRTLDDRNMSSQKKWQEPNGYRINSNIRGSRAHASNPSRRYSRTADLDDFEDDVWPASPELTSVSSSVCSNSSLMPIVTPLSPSAFEGWFLF